MISPPENGDDLLAAYRKRVAQAGETLALLAPDGALSFAELDHQSEVLAAHLGPVGCRVGLLLSPSRAYYLAVVACMKAGVIAVPLDPAVPPQVRAAVAPLARCLTLASGREQAESLADAVMLLDQVQYIDAAPVALPLRLGPALHQLSTSGSGGQPTTVTLGRQAVLGHTREMGPAYGLAPGSVQASLARHHTAAGLNAWWRALLNGCTFLSVDLQQESLLTVYRRFQQAQVQGLQATPTVLDALAEVCADQAPLASVARLVLGGEPLHPARLRRISHFLPADCLFSYNYSSSETLHIAVFTAPLQQVINAERIPCGTPLPSRQVVIVGPTGQPVAPGEAGEITVISASLALEISGGAAERMTPHPKDPALKIYRTRDLGRWNAQGQLEHLGRLDRQLKIRGQRVDPLVIEVWLERQAGISRAVVLGLASASDQQELVACWVGQGLVVDPAALLRLMTEQLPAASVPARLIQVAQLPLLPSGKVDLKALQVHVQTVIEAPAEAHPAPAWESRVDGLCQLWSQVLGRVVTAEAGPFAAEGGDSLMALRLVAALEQQGYPALGPAWVSRYPTLRAQAQALGASPEARLPKPAPELPVPEEPDLQAILRRVGWV